MSRAEPHRSYLQQYRKCGKPRCSTCQRGPGHGPYWYAFWREQGRMRSAYIGKSPPPRGGERGVE